MSSTKWGDLSCRKYLTGKDTPFTQPEITYKVLYRMLKLSRVLSNTRSCQFTEEFQRRKRILIAYWKPLPTNISANQLLTAGSIEIVFFSL